MRIAVLSDVHGNLEALREVLADIDRSRTDAVLCLGDNIGYGPEPEAVVESIRERGIPCVMGNHELGLVDETYLDWFNTSARLSLLLTRELISSDTLEYMRRLQPSLSFQACLVCAWLPAGLRHHVSVSGFRCGPPDAVPKPGGKYLLCRPHP